MNRGEIWTAAGGVYSSKPRPVLLIQDDLFSNSDSVVVVPFTTTNIDASISRIAIPSDELSGTNSHSYAMVDKVTTIRRSSLRERVGRVSAAQMVEVERSLLVFLGIAR